LWRLCFILLLIPRPLRDKIYDFIAAKRNKLFNDPQHICERPSKEEQKRFLI